MEPGCASTPAVVLSRAKQFAEEGDAYVYRGDITRAKESYGSAIDGYLQSRDFAAAIELCRKLIRLAPDVARARYTLAFLLIGRGELQEARSLVAEYGEVVQRADAANFAIPRLQLLSQTTEDELTRMLIDRVIVDLGGSTIPAVSSRTLNTKKAWERLLNTVLRDQLG